MKSNLCHFGPKSIFNLTYARPSDEMWSFKTEFKKCLSDEQILEILG